MFSAHIYPKHHQYLPIAAFLLHCLPKINRLSHHQVQVHERQGYERSGQQSENPVSAPLLLALQWDVKFSNPNVPSLAQCCPRERELCEHAKHPFHAP